MSLTEFARAELQRAGLFDKDSDYNGMIGEAVMELVEKLAAQGHSGFSASITLAAFGRVARYQSLTPLTNKPEEWMEVSPGMFQSRRQATAFSDDGLKTYYDLDEAGRPKHELGAT